MRYSKCHNGATDNGVTCINLLRRDDTDPDDV
jgi:hypothetical protein